MSCDLCQALFGPYWIVAYDEAEGYALVSGGQPTIPTKDGLCKTGDGVNNAGLWIFSRSPVRDEALIAKVRRAHSSGILYGTRKAHAASVWLVLLIHRSAASPCPRASTPASCWCVPGSCMHGYFFNFCHWL